MYNIKMKQEQGCVLKGHFAMVLFHQEKKPQEMFI